MSGGIVLEKKGYVSLSECDTAVDQQEMTGVAVT
eukprot:CAMPEP_0206275894 /NCGR_PEP_ID=MMETSP0047_2-20121206/36008_1 /ASSEMBLY_ACC=CAM_ASM_000192 /TAXON_ID=195065 /ORGANISM="Chroomonas mesostigmatica_cf, Strain CCMP1168" /LENGTH=33 /DNA_ID=CAMNT_0053705359 /DNA_START=384 /DNA_END=481 /DNA_ORIENTATION=+